MRLPLTVAITGASSGIGKACAQMLAAHGYRVYGTFHATPVTMPGVTLSKVDVRDEASVREWIGDILQEEGSIDILINNAGIHLAGATELVCDKELDEIFKVNFFGAIHTIREVLPSMRSFGRGHIINISSIGGRIGLPFQGAYCASKFALEGLTESLHYELKSTGVRVTLLEPGDFATPIVHRRIVNGASIVHNHYSQVFQAVLNTISADEESGPAPVLAAKRVLQIIRKKQPDLRYSCGRFSQRAALWLSRLLPGVLFRNIISRKYLKGDEPSPHYSPRVAPVDTGIYN